MRPFSNIVFNRWMGRVILREDNFICLFIGVSINLHFPLITPLVNLFHLQIYLYQELSKKSEISSAKVLHIEVRLLGRSRAEKVPISSIVETQNWFFSTQMFGHLKQLFVQNFLKLNKRSSSQIYQIIWKYLIRHLWRKQLDCYQTQFVFYILLMGIWAIGNLIGKVQKVYYFWNSWR